MVGDARQRKRIGGARAEKALRARGRKQDANGRVMVIFQSGSSMLSITRRPV
jgi:hypothetical protein